MNTATVALIILSITIILFFIEKIPLMITAILAMLAMAFTGVIPYQAAFSGFSNSVVLMILGMSIVSASLTKVGFASVLSNFVLRFNGLTEKKFIILSFIVAMCLGCFVVPMIVVATLAPILDFTAEASNGNVRRKMTYLPLAIGASVGSHMSCLSATCILTASAMLAESYYGRGMSLFEPLRIGLPGALICLLFFLTVGYKYICKRFTFEEIPSEQIKAIKDDAKAETLTWRSYAALAVFVGCIAAFVAGCNFGAVAMLGACLVMLLGCITPAEAVKSVSWTTVLTVGASLGFAQGVSASGAGQIIAESIMNLFGAFGQSPYLMCVLMLFLSTLLSNFMSNTAAVTTTFPIAIVIAQKLGADPMAFALACGLGADMSLATPICVAQITYTVSVGYRVRDYLSVGGLLNLLIFIADSAALYFVFFA